MLISCEAFTNFMAPDWRLTSPDALLATRRGLYTHTAAIVEPAANLTGMIWSQSKIRQDKMMPIWI